MGFSDITSLTTWINQQGLVTFNGPSIMAGFSQWNSFTKEYKQYTIDYLFNNLENFPIPQFQMYSDGYPE